MAASWKPSELACYLQGAGQPVSSMPRANLTLAMSIGKHVVSLTFCYKTRNAHRPTPNSVTLPIHWEHPHTDTSLACTAFPTAHMIPDNLSVTHAHLCVPPQPASTCTCGQVHQRPQSRFSRTALRLLARYSPWLPRLLFGVRGPWQRAPRMARAATLDAPAASYAAYRRLHPVGTMSTSTLSFMHSPAATRSHITERRKCHSVCNARAVPSNLGFSPKGCKLRSEHLLDLCSLHGSGSVCIQLPLDSVSSSQSRPRCHGPFHTLPISAPSLAKRARCRCTPHPTRFRSSIRAIPIEAALSLNDSPLSAEDRRASLQERCVMTRTAVAITWLRSVHCSGTHAGYHSFCIAS